MNNIFYEDYKAYAENLCCNLGNAIRFVILQEFKDVTSRLPLNYYSVMSYLYLNDMVTSDTVRYFKVLFASTQDEKYSQQELGQLFVRNLMEDDKFKTFVSEEKAFEDILDDLNNYEMDRWIITKGLELYGLLPKIYLMDDKLFFFEGNDEKTRFMVINIEDIYVQNSLIGDAEVISYRYDDFVDYNKRTEGEFFLLKYKHISDYYCKYNHAMATEVCAKGDVVGFAGDIVVSIEENNGERWIAYKDKGNYIGLTKYEIDMNYIVKPEYVLVCPRKGWTRFIKPYRVYYDSKITDSSYEEALAVLWDRLCDMTVVNVSKDIEYIDKETVLQRERFKKIPKKLTLKFLWKKFQEYESAELKQHMIRLIYMLKVLRANLDDETDFMELLYVLIDVSLKEKTSLMGNEQFPAESLYIEMLTWQRDGLFKDNDTDADRWSMTLYKRLKLKYENAPEFPFERPAIGTFYFDEDMREFKYDHVGWGDCEMFGTVIVPKIRKYEGVVTRDTNSGVFCFNYHKDIPEEYKESISEAFHIECYDLLWIKNR